MATTTYPVPTSFTATHNGPRLPVVNNRVSPTDASKYVQRTDRLTVEEYYDDPTVSFARLYEAATAEVGGKGLVVRAASGSKTFAGTMTYPPGPSQYYFNPNMGFLFFNKADNHEVILASYTARGSIIAAEEINWLWNATTASARPWIENVFEIPPGTNRDFTGRIILDVFEVLDTGEYLVNPKDAEVRVFNPDSEKLYYSRLYNRSEVVKRYKVRAITKLEPEK